MALGVASRGTPRCGSSPCASPFQLHHRSWPGSGVKPSFTSGAKDHPRRRQVRGRTAARSRIHFGGAAGVLGVRRKHPPAQRWTAPREPNSLRRSGGGLGVRRKHPPAQRRTAPREPNSLRRSGGGVGATEAPQLNDGPRRGAEFTSAERRGSGVRRKHPPAHKGGLTCLQRRVPSRSCSALVPHLLRRDLAGSPLLLSTFVNRAFPGGARQRVEAEGQLACCWRRPFTGSAGVRSSPCLAGWVLFGLLYGPLRCRPRWTLGRGLLAESGC